MSLLTERQRLELNKSLIQYLKPAIPEELLASITQELDVNQEDLVNITPNYLEKKWSTVIRLQKKIIDLETEIENLRSIIETNGINGNNSINLNSILNGKFNWLPTSNTSILRGHKDSITSIAIHPFLPQLVSGCNDGSFIVWDLMNPLEPEKIVKAHIRSINDVCFSPIEIQISNNSTKKVIVLATCSSDLCVRIWDSEFNQIRTLSGHEHTVSSIRFKPNEPNHIYSCSRDNTIRLWDISSGWCLKSFIGHSDWVRKLDISPNGEYILSCSNDQSIRLSHGESGTGLALLIGHGHVVETCKFLPEQSNSFLDETSLKFLAKETVENEAYQQLTFKYCASGGRDDIIRIWLLPLPVLRPHRPPLPSSDPTGKCLLELKGHSSWIKSLEIHPNGKYLFSSSDDKTIKVWDLSQNGKCIKTLRGHDGFVNDIKFAPLIKDNINGAKEEPSTSLINSNSSTNVKKSAEDIEKEHIEKRIRCIFASGAVDNTVRLWS